MRVQDPQVCSEHLECPIQRGNPKKVPTIEFLLAGTVLESNTKWFEVVVVERSVYTKSSIIYIYVHI